MKSNNYDKLSDKYEKNYFVFNINLYNKPDRFIQPMVFDLSLV